MARADSSGLHDLEWIDGVDAHAKGTPDYVSLIWSRDCQPDPESASSRPQQLTLDVDVFEHLAFERGRMNLVQLKAIAHESSALGDLAPERVER
jgi:hypothetical protein